MAELAERLWTVIGPYVEAEGVELDDVEVVGAGRGRIVRVTVDAPGGIPVDRVAGLSRGLSHVLDEADVVDGTYTLEVGSPGLERKLRRRTHYTKAVGREVTVKTHDDVAGSHTHRGVLESASEVDFVIDVDGERRVIPYAQVKEARTRFTWERGVKPGARR